MRFPSSRGGQEMAGGAAGVGAEADVELLPADIASVAMAGAVAGDAGAGVGEAAEMFAVDVEKFAEVCASSGG